MTDSSIVWLRRDLRLGDNAALLAAIAAGGTVVPLFIYDEAVEALGAAARQRLGASLARLQADLTARGSRLVLRTGPARITLDAVVAETGAKAVHWHRSYDPTYRARDTEIKASLTARGVEAVSHRGFLLVEPWDVATQTGGPYRVYSPFWRAVRERVVAAPRPRPARLPAPDHWPASEALADWPMTAAMDRGAVVLAAHIQAGEGAALDRLDRFLDGPIDGYRDRRDYPAANATSNMSEHLTWGEVSPATLWHAGLTAMERGAAGAEHFLKELVWRDFAWHLTHHTPELLDRSWRPEWADFPWRTNEDSAEVTAWKQARTGVPLVDAGLREMYVTGRMHNRVRMVVASYLTKNLLAHWRIGQAWFAECLTDWDPASNAMGWQWVAGTGPDAAPFFRVFNPVTQAEKFDADRAYLRRWLAEGQSDPSPESLAYFEAVPRSWGMDANGPYPQPSIELPAARARALAAYDGFRRQRDARNP